MSSDSPAVIVYNQDGYPIGVTYDGYTYRFHVDAALKLGTSVLIGGEVPTDPTLIIANKLTNGGSSNMLVDGSSVPVDFKYNADSLKDIKLSEVRLVLVASSLHFRGTRFGDRLELPNGVQIKVKSNGVEVILATLTLNEDFLAFHSPNQIFMDQGGTNDVIAVGYLIGGAIELKAGTDDYLGITIQDDLTHGSYKYFQATGYGIKDV